MLFHLASMSTPVSDDLYGLFHWLAAGFLWVEGVGAFGLGHSFRLATDDSLLWNIRTEWAVRGHDGGKGEDVPHLVPPFLIEQSNHFFHDSIRVIRPKDSVLVFLCLLLAIHPAGCIRLTSLF